MDKLDRSDFSQWKQPPADWLRSAARSQTPATQAAMIAIADAFESNLLKLDKYRGVVVAALNWRGTCGIPNDEINEQLMDALDEIDASDFRLEPKP